MVSRFRKSLGVTAGIFVLVICAGYVLGQQVTLLTTDKEPSFSSFEIAVYTGKIASPKMSGDPDLRNFRSRILAASGKAANFGGQYHLVSWGCGGGCRIGAMINLRSGQVVMLPHAIAGSFEYRKNSRLLVMHGVRNESESDDEADEHYYEVSGSKFLYLGTVRRSN